MNRAYVFSWACRVLGLLAVSIAILGAFCDVDVPSAVAILSGGDTAPLVTTVSAVPRPFVFHAQPWRDASIGASMTTGIADVTTIYLVSGDPCAEQWQIVCWGLAPGLFECPRCGHALATKDRGFGALDGRVSLRIPDAGRPSLLWTGCVYCLRDALLRADTAPVRTWR